MAEEITGRRIYDPRLGKERDAFPEEVLPEDQQSTLQRLMAEEMKKYEDMVQAAVGAKIATPENDRIVLGYGLAAAEKKREEYRRAIKTNPANLIAEVFKKLNPGNNGAASFALQVLNARVDENIRRVEAARNEDTVAGRSLRSAAVVVDLFYNRGGVNSYNIPLRSILATYEPRDTLGNLDEQSVQTLLTELAAYPTPKPVNIIQLFQALPAYNGNINESRPKTPYTEQVRGSSLLVLRNLKANKPGLEGIGVNVVIAQNAAIKSVDITGDVKAIARVVDIGGYAPYSPPQQQAR